MIGDDFQTLTEIYLNRHKITTYTFIQVTFYNTHRALRPQPRSVLLQASVQPQ